MSFRPHKDPENPYLETAHGSAIKLSGEIPYLDHIPVPKSVWTSRLSVRVISTSEEFKAMFRFQIKTFWTLWGSLRPLWTIEKSKLILVLGCSVNREFSLKGWSRNYICTVSEHGYSEFFGGQNVPMDGREVQTQFSTTGTWFKQGIFPKSLIVKLCTVSE